MQAKILNYSQIARHFRFIFLVVQAFTCTKCRKDEK